MCKSSVFVDMTGFEATLSYHNSIGFALFLGGKYEVLSLDRHVAFAPRDDIVAGRHLLGGWDFKTSKSVQMLAGVDGCRMVIHNFNYFIF
jgi:hypothetical protein